MGQSKETKQNAKSKQNALVSSFGILAIITKHLLLEGRLGTRLCLDLCLFLISPSFLRSEVLSRLLTRGNFYTKLIMLDTKFRFTCSKSNLY